MTVKTFLYDIYNYFLNGKFHEMCVKQINTTISTKRWKHFLFRKIISSLNYLLIHIKLLSLKCWWYKISSFELFLKCREGNIFIFVYYFSWRTNDFYALQLINLLHVKMLFSVVKMYHLIVNIDLELSQSVLYYMYWAWWDVICNTGTPS